MLSCITVAVLTVKTGKYYLCEPGGEILKRNTAYFAPFTAQKDYVNGSGSA